MLPSLLVLTLAFPTVGPEQAAPGSEMSGDFCGTAQASAGMPTSQRAVTSTASNTLEKSFLSPMVVCLPRWKIRICDGGESLSAGGDPDRVTARSQTAREEAEVARRVAGGTWEGGSIHRPPHVTPSDEALRCAPARRPLADSPPSAGPGRASGLPLARWRRCPEPVFPGGGRGATLRVWASALARRRQNQPRRCAARSRQAWTRAVSCGIENGFVR